METGQYRTFTLYNEPNGLRLYAVDLTSSAYACIKVFLSESDMECWIESISCLLKPCRIRLEFNADKVSRCNIMEMYEKAEELFIRGGEVYIKCL